MKRTHGKSMFFLILMSTALLVGIAVAGEPATGSVNQVRDRWAQINYQLPKPQREAAFEALLHQSEKIRQANPRDAAALIWEGIVLSSLAGEKGGMGALGLVKRARADFEAAIKLDANALDGAAYTSLGALYYQVPGWPLGFGDDAADVRWIPHHPGVLYDRQCDAEDIGFLEGVRADAMRRHLARDANERNRVHHRRGEARHQVGGAGSGGDQDHAHPAGAAGVAFGGVHRALLVADQDVLQLRAGQGVIDRHDGAARITEQMLHAVILQGFQNDFRPCHPIVCCTRHVLVRYLLCVKRGLGA